MLRQHLRRRRVLRLRLRQRRMMRRRLRRQRMLRLRLRRRRMMRRHLRLRLRRMPCGALGAILAPVGAKIMLPFFAFLGRRAFW